MADLTAKQQQFCKEYLIDLNGTQAAIRAGYSQKGASVAATKLLANGKIQAQIGKLDKARQERVQVDADWVLYMLRKNVMRAMQEEELFDAEGKPKGIFKYEGSVANKALELIGKNCDMFGGDDGSDKGPLKLEISITDDDLGAAAALKQAAKRNVGGE